MKGITKLKDILNEVHPKQIVYAGEFMSIYKVTYSYVTKRNNKRQGIKYFICNSYNPQKDLTPEMTRYVNDFNNKYPYKQISNVKILETVWLGSVGGI